MNLMLHFRIILFDLQMHTLSSLKQELGELSLSRLQVTHL